MHLGPLPIASIQTLSCFFTLCLASKYANSYHKEEEDWFPNLFNVSKAGSKSLSSRFNPFPISFVTALPDVGKQKCSITDLKLGTLFKIETPYQIFSVKGKICDPRIVTLDLSVSPAVSNKFRFSVTPVNPLRDKRKNSPYHRKLFEFSEFEIACILLCSWLLSCLKLKCQQHPFEINN